MAVNLTKHATRRHMPAEYATRAIVTARGWTQTAISRFLAEPDGTLPNLRYRGSPPTRLYAMDRVRAVEGTREWQDWYLASQRRRSAAARAGAHRAAAGGPVPGGGPANATSATPPRVDVPTTAGGGEGPGSLRPARARVSAAGGGPGASGTSGGEAPPARRSPDGTASSAARTHADAVVAGHTHIDAPSATHVCAGVPKAVSRPDVSAARGEAARSPRPAHAMAPSAANALVRDGAGAGRGVA